jgi:hypothetical protein
MICSSRHSKETWLSAIRGVLMRSEAAGLSPASENSLMPEGKSIADTTPDEVRVPASRQKGWPAMSANLTENLPDVLKLVRTRPLFVMRLEVRKLQIVGATPGSYRRIGVVPGGTFEGERLSGTVLEGGSDWQAVRPDGATTLDVRLVLKTADDAMIGMTYRGIRHGPADVIKRIESGEVVDPTSYYFRINPLFETAAPRYDWLNRVIAVGIGHRQADGPVYSVFEVL